MDDPTEVLHRAFSHALDYLEALDSSPVAATSTLAELRHRLQIPLTAAPTPAATVIDDLVTATAGGQLGSAGGRFFAWVIGGALPSALAADWLAATWDVNAGLYACGPAAARHGLLAARGWDVEANGLAGSPPIRLLATEQHHGSINRALRILGIGTRALQPLATDENGRLRKATLDRALKESDSPTILVLDAGDLNIGAYDPFAELIPLAHEAGAWVHIDGAFGLWARASPRYRHLADGVERADSWATDAHKWLNTPQDNGIAIVRNREPHRAAMTISAHYLVAGGDARDALDWTPEWTRRARGYPIYAALRELGRDGLASLIERCCDHCMALTLGIGGLAGAELVAAPSLNQGLVRFLAPDGDHDRRTDATIAAINAEGTAYFSGTTFRGQRAMRISVVNWRTSEADVRRTIKAVERVLADGFRDGPN